VLKKRKKKKLKAIVRI